MVIVFERVAEEVGRHLKAGKGTTTNVELLRPLDRRARRILSLFAEQETIQSCDVAALLGISTRQTRVLLVQWVEQGWLVMTDASNKGRKYALEKKYIGLIKE